MSTLAAPSSRPIFRRIAAAAAIALTSLLAACESLGFYSAEQQPAQPAIGLYELRTYTAAPGKLPALDARFRDHTVELFQKHGMTPIGFWHVYTAPNQPADDRLIYLMGYKDRATRDASWAAFAADPDWVKARTESEKNGALLISPGGVQSSFLSASEYSPKLNLTPSPAARHFELRTYTANPGKLENIHARFRDHTIGIFSRLGMTNFMYWRPVADQPAMADKMVYMMAYPTPAARTTMWQAFGADPEWVKARTESEAAGPLLKSPGGVVSVQLTPTDYSPLR